MIGTLGRLVSAPAAKQTQRIGSDLLQQYIISLWSSEGECVGMSTSGAAEAFVVIHRSLSFTESW